MSTVSELGARIHPLHSFTLTIMKSIVVFSAVAACASVAVASVIQRSGTPMTQAAAQAKVRHFIS
jgi:hypothetical protein